MKMSWFAYLLLIIVIITLIDYSYRRIMADRYAIATQYLDINYPIQFNHTLKLATYNIAHGRGYKLHQRNWKGGDKQQKIQRLQSIGKLLSQQGADIVVLNEVDISAFWSHHINQAEVIAKAGGYPYVATQKDLDIVTPFAKLQIGNAILSRYPIESVQLKRFPPHSYTEALLAGNHDSMIATLRLNQQKKLKLWAIHLEYREEKTRLNAAELILQEQKTSKEDMIIAGDFNSQPNESTQHKTAISELMHSGYYKYFPKNKSQETLTFPTEYPHETLDWILFPKHMRLIQGKILSARYSDHLSVFVALHSP